MQHPGRSEGQGALFKVTSPMDLFMRECSTISPVSNFPISVEPFEPFSHESESLTKWADPFDMRLRADGGTVRSSLPGASEEVEHTRRCADCQTAFLDRLSSVQQGLKRLLKYHVSRYSGAVCLFLDISTGSFCEDAHFS